MRLTSLATLLLLVVSSAGCFGEKEDDTARRLDEKGFRDVLSEASEDEYNPPADGRLTREQIEMYLEVREREQEIARVARERIEKSAEELRGEEKSLSGLMKGIKSLGSAADFFTADVRAAQELGYNTAEYEWVKSQIMKAVGSVMSERVAQASRAAAERQAQELRLKMEQADNETERNTYARILETYEKSVAGDGEREIDETVAYNRELLSEYEDALDTISSELEKFETREGQAREQAQELDADLEALERGADPASTAGEPGP